ncbi:hypothetical protein IHE44_0014114 [Lamprotornis superbus]|uniref:Uncharacterized protein n=1 Tax=Lamprotornis superbus TaxID=245042 RepID=A0A835NM53_9PASS|nr:hypothetical protein IHE44_0014114 [Lamprotornis superbus]
MILQQQIKALERWLVELKSFKHLIKFEEDVVMVATLENFVPVGVCSKAIFQDLETLLEYA